MKGPLIEWGVASLTLPGQDESGDRYIVRPLPAGVLVAVVDGLGHGDEAAAAAKSAVAWLEYHAHESVITLMKRCHESLRATRGVVMSLASFNGLDETITWLGVGNVEGTLVRVDPDARPTSESLLLRGGVIGRQLPPLRASIIPVMRGDTLLFYTDGVRPPSLEELALGSPPQQIADRILADYAKGTDDALVVVTRFNGQVP